VQKEELKSKGKGEGTASFSFFVFLFYKRKYKNQKERLEAKEKCERRVAPLAQDFSDLPCPRMLCNVPKETTAAQDHARIEAVASSLDSAFSASEHPSLETREPLICQVVEMSLHVVRTALLKDCDTRVKQGRMGQRNKTRVFLIRGAVEGGRNKKMSRGRGMEGHG